MVKRGKRWVSVLLVCILLVGMMPVKAQTQTVAQGICGENLTWVLDDAGTLTVSGTGEMTDYSYSSHNTPWADVRTVIKKVVVQSGVTSISSYAFENCYNISRLILAEGITSIGEYAFYNCSALTGISIPDSIEQIGRCAFQYTADDTSDNRENGGWYLDNWLIEYTSSNATTYEIKNGCVGIADFAFQDSNTLGNIVIPSSIRYIGDYAFTDCSSLASVIIPYGVIKIGTSAFSGCTLLSNISIPDSVTCVGNNPFFDTSYYNNEENWEDGFLYIDGWLVEGDSISNSSDSYAVKDTCVGIAADTYWPQSYTSIYIPQSVRHIGIPQSFPDDIMIDENNSNYCVVDGAVYDKNIKKLIVCTQKTGTFVVPDGVVEIETGAFPHSFLLSAIHIPQSVTHIEVSEFPGYYSPKIVVDEENAFYCSDNGILYDKNMQTLLYCPTRVTGTYSIPSGVTKIGENAFAYSSISDIEIPDTVKYIGNGAFSNAKNLQQLTIPSSVVYIEHEAFEECQELQSIELPDTITNIRPYVFSGCSKLKNITIPSSIKCIGEWAFSYCDELEGISIPKSVTKIGYNAFLGVADYITDADGAVYIDNWLVRRPAQVTTFTTKSTCVGIASGSFLYGDQVNNIVLTHGVKYICEAAFEPISLTEISIPVSVDVIDFQAFSGCKNLTDVYYAGSEIDWEKIAIDRKHAELTGATIHFNVGDDGRLIVAENCTQIQLTGDISGMVFVAIYDEQYALIEITSYDAAATITPQITENAARYYAKVFWWQSTAAIQPVCQTKSVRFS